MGPAANELLVQWYSLAAEGALVGAVCRKVPAYEAEDGAPVEVDRRPAPEAADADDVGPKLLDELDQKVERRSGRDEILHQKHLGPRTEQAMELDGEAHLALTAGQALRPVDDDGPRRVRARHAMRQDQGAGTGREHHVDGPLSEVLRDDSAQPLGERRLGGDERLLDVLRRVLARGKQDVVVGVIRARALEDLEMNLLPDLGFDGGRIFLRGGGAHRYLPAHYIAGFAPPDRYET